jgi:hypothetical protein
MFSRDELILIFEDQRTMLESAHIGSCKQCSSVADCPSRHFDPDEDIEDIFMRQKIMKKIGKLVANKKNDSGGERK